MEKTRLAVVSNRLAIVVTKEADGGYGIKSGSGGLWIGWLGANIRESMSEDALKRKKEKGKKGTELFFQPLPSGHAGRGGEGGQVQAGTVRGQTAPRFCAAAADLHWARFVVRGHGAINRR